MEPSLESELARLLGDILTVQGDLLSVISKKRECLADPDAEGLDAIGVEEQRLSAVLAECMQRREHLLEVARKGGLPNDSLDSLSRALPRERRDAIHANVQRAKHQAKLLRTESLTNWLIIQRTLLHLSQMLEILATGGRKTPTYGDKQPVGATGGLVDQAG